MKRVVKLMEPGNCPFCRAKLSRTFNKSSPNIHYSVYISTLVFLTRNYSLGELKQLKNIAATENSTSPYIFDQSSTLKKSTGTVIFSTVNTINIFRVPDGFSPTGPNFRYDVARWDYTNSWGRPLQDARTACGLLNYPRASQLPF